MTRQTRRDETNFLPGMEPSGPVQVSRDALPCRVLPRNRILCGDAVAIRLDQGLQRGLGIRLHRAWVLASSRPEGWRSMRRRDGRRDEELRQVDDDVQACTAPHSDKPHCLVPGADAVLH